MIRTYRNRHPSPPSSAEEWVSRVLYPLVNEGFRALWDGTAHRPLDIDVVYVHGYGWPAYRGGGPMGWADDEVTLPVLLRTLEHYAATIHWHDFTPSPLLRRCVRLQVGIHEYYDRGYHLADVGIQDDKEVVLAAVSKSSSALQYASMTQRRDREVVLAAVAKNGLALQFASPDLRENREFVLSAVARNFDVILRVRRDLWIDREFVLAVVAQNAFALRYATMHLRGDREIVLTAVAQGFDTRWLALNVHTDLWREREFVLEAVRRNGWMLQFAHVDLTCDSEVIRVAMDIDDL